MLSGAGYCARQPSSEKLKRCVQQKGLIMNIRPMTSDDQAFLWEILYHAIHVEPGSEPPPPAIVKQPELAIYVEDFGRSGDVGFIAEEEGLPIGAAWARLMHGYGFVDAETPELTIALMPGYQGRGIGTQLLEKLFEALKPDFESVSLSVTMTNIARRLYERLGFETLILEDGTATMRKLL
jgi:ribosomal protein S18 acetylase RimI-like enzyme